MSASTPLKLLERARPEILAMQPYSSARMEAGQATIMLNANESPWAPAGDAGPGLNRYPDPQPPALRNRLAELYGIAAEQVLVGRGSDEAIDLLVRAFCREGRDTIAISPPTFGMYAVAARTQGAAVIEAPLGADFAVDADAMLAKISDSTKLVFVCTPNNPTGALVPPGVVEKLALALRDRALVVVDEAYLEFAGDAASAATLLGRHENLAVLRTLSKAYALAGARVGTLLAHAQIVALLRRIQAPYPIPAPCADAALAALSAQGVARARERIATLLGERERLARALPSAAGVLAVYPSSANFLCVRFADAPKAYRTLLALGIIVRDVSRYPGLADCLRITIGTPQENASLLGALGLRESAA
ncbi:MAG: histidinol-phosphate transaminase [Proteobacteria bacterium]|uniref:histidinol-phosphate transaminase n=1 Tax=Rudaea sp. TaxID=2136325 RepID=UPI001DC6AA69|nr:histidinol-phosphate transaminase [Pseudomonadota bacterium]MBS0568631.1 histidinol-phosphate transaminase [Pseudomonadota bacterium]